MGRLVSRRGKAKYHPYTLGQTFNKRKARAKREAEAAAVARIESSVSDFLHENLSSKIEWEVEAWLCGGSVAETESVCSEAEAADIWL